MSAVFSPALQLTLEFELDPLWVVVALCRGFREYTGSAKCRMSGASAHLSGNLIGVELVDLGDVPPWELDNCRLTTASIVGPGQHLYPRGLSLF